MPLVDRQSLRTEIGRNESWLKVRPGAPKEASGINSGTLANGITDSALYSSAIDQFVKQRDVIAITSGARRGERSFATGPPSSAGVVTVSPPFSGPLAPGDTYEIWDADGPHPDIVDRMIDKALAEDLFRWQPVPLGYIPGGDFGEELGIGFGTIIDASNNNTTIWTRNSGSLGMLFVTPSFENEFTRRVLQLVANANGLYLELTNALQVDPELRPSWYVSAFVRVTGQTEIVLRDVTNGQNITPAKPLTHSGRGWRLLESSFQLPSTCRELNIRLSLPTSGSVAEYAWIQAWPIGQTRFSLPPRVGSVNDVGTVFYHVGNTFDEFRRELFQGAVERREYAGRRVQITLEPGPAQKRIWYYEKKPFIVPGSSGLTGPTPTPTDDDNTTFAPAAWVVAAATWEIYEYLKRRDRHTRPGLWDDLLAQAKLRHLAFQQQYGAEPMTVEESARPHRIALPWRV